MRRILILFTIAFLAINGCTKRVDIEAEKARIQLVFDQWAQAMRTEDIESISNIYCHDDDIVTFSKGSIYCDGWEQWKELLQSWFDSIDNYDISISRQVIKVHASGKVAWISFYFDEHFVARDVSFNIKGGRFTGILEKRSGKWVIVHSHTSIPRAKQSIPILMYHHINYHEDGSVTISPEDFEAHLKYLTQKKYKSIFMDELLDYIEGKKKLPPFSVAITFDDGYLDNWVYAYPLLKKYNFKATIFLVTSRPKEKGSLRPNLEALWKGRIAEDEIPKIENHDSSNRQAVAHERGCDSSLNWEEMREMLASGLIDIQSHGHLHGYYYVSDKLTGFNRNLHWASGWPTDGDTRLGIPLYEKKSTLVARRYFDNLKLRDILSDYVRKHGDESYFKEDEADIWKSELREIFFKFSYPQGHLKGHYESLEEQKKRINWELILSKELIERKLGKKCDYIAWPWGRYDKRLFKWAKDCGYRGAVTIAEGANSPGDNPMSLKRINIKKGNIQWFKRILWIRFEQHLY